jgi:hypothetical protein
MCLLHAMCQDEFWGSTGMGTDISARVGQGPMRSGIFVGVVAGVFNLCINRNGTLPVRRQIKQKTPQGDLKLSETRTGA